nr:MAG TPA: hypothetical protein [Caudoviricetes sp.]
MVQSSKEDLLRSLFWCCSCHLYRLGMRRNPHP